MSHTSELSPCSRRGDSKLDVALHCHALHSTGRAACCKLCTLAGGNDCNVSVAVNPYLTVFFTLRLLTSHR